MNLQSTVQQIAATLSKEIGPIEITLISIADKPSKTEIVTGYMYDNTYMQSIVSITKLTSSFAIGDKDGRYIQSNNPEDFQTELGRQVFDRAVSWFKEKRRLLATKLAINHLGQSFKEDDELDEYGCKTITLKVAPTSLHDVKQLKEFLDRDLEQWVSYVNKRTVENTRGTNE